MSDKIKQRITEIQNLEDSVREHINTTRYQSDLISNGDNWNQICCSLDTIGDTVYAINDYINFEYPENTGLSYIYTYGVLQALFIQQDAIKHLSKAFDIDYHSSKRLLNIRDIRNAAIGHPTKQTRKQKNTIYNYISRMTLAKSGFTLMRCSGENETTFEKIQLLEIIQDQLNEIGGAYQNISNQLKEKDKMHKEKHKDTLLIDIFHSSMNYSFQKIASGIHTPAYSNQLFALSMLEMVESTYQKFEDTLNIRGELNEYIQHDLSEYKHGLSRLKNYLKGENEDMTQQDANIYHFYIREEHKTFEKIAKEIDDEYKTQ